MPPEIKTPAEVGQDQGEGKVITQQDELSARRVKRKTRNVGGRYLYRYGPTGTTVFDTWVWFGEPLPRRRRR